MTDIEKLILQSHAAQLDLLRTIAHGAGDYHDNRAENVQKEIEATLDSATADEIDALK